MTGGHEPRTEEKRVSKMELGSKGPVEMRCQERCIGRKMWPGPSTPAPDLKKDQQPHQI